MKITQFEINRFWSNLIIPENHEFECWKWKLYIRSDTNAPIYTFRNKLISAYRFMYWIWYGFPNNSTTRRIIYHTCGNRSCMNPHHLYINHQMYSTRIYKIYEDLIARVLNKNHPSFKDYGGRGIDIDPRYNPFLENQNRHFAFLNFQRDVVDIGYNDSLMIDRIDNNLGYWKSNIRFVSNSVNCQNRRTTKLTPEIVKTIRLDYENDKYTQKELAKQYNVPESHIRMIISRKRWKNI